LDKERSPSFRPSPDVCDGQIHFIAKALVLWIGTPKLFETLQSPQRKLMVSLVPPEFEDNCRLAIKIERNTRLGFHQFLN
jgi:hypothetical protein